MKAKLVSKIAKIKSQIQNLTEQLGKAENELEKLDFEEREKHFIYVPWKIFAECARSSSSAWQPYKVEDPLEDVHRCGNGGDCYYLGHMNRLHNMEMVRLKLPDDREWFLCSACSSHKENFGERYFEGDAFDEDDEPVQIDPTVFEREYQEILKKAKVDTPDWH